ncbi:Surface polysaccharide O-acyltransferase, integral membrane enzyme [Butyrivibrio fibrisolvens DSM 3071]|uniref:Surface polysaccharide O-acyltransferase, integral membrane enzyme n=1 Tax=Butyrivibrio fibrisolvens DSM 3071 TaxID=1121131 RepID=A0A1M5Z2P7_BUTFI|nr:acyltransferase family protein [Butyrivibrio fibrisolvens]SHI18515.1 Surface polysaccharide O-acyltransferase, integral membrane enzyme [Butyrivibrio fibrisolvens DSM 3071]
MTDTQKNHVNHNINLLRIIACFAVIILHTSAEHLFDVKYGTFDSLILNLGHGITRFAVTCFFLISGSLYLDKSYKIKDKRKYFMKIVHFISLYFFYAIFYSGCALLFSKQLGMNLFNDIKLILEHAILNPKYHLWYLPAYIGVLFAIPILKKFIGNDDDGQEKPIIKYALAFVFISMIFTSLESFQIGSLNKAMDFLQLFTINGFAKWAGVCLLGYYIYNHVNKNYKTVYFLIIALFTLSLFASYFYFDRIETTFYENLRIQTTLFSCVVYDFFVNRIKINLTDNLLYKIDYLASLTLGIYLIHPFLLNIFNEIGFSTIMCNSALALPLVAATTFVLSTILVAIAKKIPFLRKLVT